MNKYSLLYNRIPSNPAPSASGSTRPFGSIFNQNLPMTINVYATSEADAIAKGDEILTLQVYGTEPIPSGDLPFQRGAGKVGTYALASVQLLELGGVQVTTSQNDE